jgi:DNA-binding transcriptional ArsR family regulator
MMRILEPIDPVAVDRALAAVPPEELLATVVDAFDALADRTRARILYALGVGELCVRDLAIIAGVSESAASHQLRLLRDRRVVKPRRAGTTIYYAVDDQHVTAMIREAEYHADHVRRSLPDHVPYAPAAPTHHEDG